MALEQKNQLLIYALKQKLLSLGMVTAILSMGPVILFDTHLQDLLAAQLEGLGHDAAVNAVGVISKYSHFRRRMPYSQVLASERLWNILKAGPLPLQLDHTLKQISHEQKRSYRSSFQRWWHRRTSEN